MRESICCVTGPPLKALPGGKNERQPACLALKARLKETLKQMHGMGISALMTGLIPGADLWTAEALLEIQAADPDFRMRLTCVLSSAEQTILCPKERSARYCAVLRRANEVVCLSTLRYTGCARARNLYIISHSSRLIAVCGSAPGPDAYLLDYAQKCGLPIERVLLDSPAMKNVL